MGNQKHSRLTPCGKNNSRRLSSMLRLPRHLPSFFLALVTMTLLGLGSAAPCHAGWWSSPEEDAYEQSRDEYKAVHEGVSETKESVEHTKKAVDEVVKQLDAEIDRLKKSGNAVPPKMKAAAAKLKNAQSTLERSQEILGNFGDYSDKVTAAMDVYDEILEVRKRMDADYQTLGALGAELDALGSMMKHADKVPILGQAIAAYGEMTVKMVDKLGQVANTIDKHKNQGLIGIGVSDTNEKARIFHEFQRNHPKELTGITYEPSTPPYLYVPEDEARGGSSVLWDEENKRFSLVPKDVPAKDIFKMTLLIDKRLSAPDLIMHMDEWKKGGAKRLDTARAMHSFFNKLRKTCLTAVSQVTREDDDKLFLLLRNPKLFEARYVYDRQTHEQLHHDLKAIHDVLLAQGDEASKAQAKQIRAFAKKYNLAIAFTAQAPVEPKKPEKKTAEKQEPSIIESFFDAIATELKKAEKGGSSPATPPHNQEEKPAPKPAATKPTGPKPAVKAGAVVGTCGECAQNGLDCACGKAACRCCAPGDANCNAFDL